MKEERTARLAKVKSKEEKFKIVKELESKENVVQRKLILAEIKENCWKRRGEKSNHEECTEKVEKEKGKEKKENVRDKVKRLEETRKLEEKKELEKRKTFMATWKVQKERKRKAEIMQLGWKKLMESVAGWEEDFGESINHDYSEEDLQTWFAQEWTSGGVIEAGIIMDEILGEVIAFKELEGLISDGSVLPNNQPTTPLLEHASRTGNNVDGEQSGRDEMNGPEMTKNSLLNDKSGARERNNMDLCPSVELSQAQNIGELSQAQKIGEVDRSEDLEKIRNEITKLEKDLFDLKKDTIACTAPLDGKKEDLLAGTVPTEKCQELPTSTASPEKSTNNLLLDRILASTAPQKSKKLKKLLARPVPPEDCQNAKLLVSPVPQDWDWDCHEHQKSKIW